MAKKRGRPKTKDNKTINIKSPETKIALGIILAFIGLIEILALFMNGVVFEYIVKLFGVSCLPFGISTILLGIYLIGIDLKFLTPRILFGIFLMSSIISTFAHFIIPTELAKEVAMSGQGGGLYGYYISKILIDFLGRFAGIIALLIMLLFAITILSGITLLQIKEFITENIFHKKITRSPQEDLNLERKELDSDYIGEMGLDMNTNPQMDGENNSNHSKNDILTDISEDNDTDNYNTNINIDNTSSNLDFSNSNKKEEDDKADSENKPHGIQYPNWTLPSPDLCEEPKVYKTSPAQYKKKGEIIEKTLRSFNIKSRVVDYSAGPRVVQYAISITIGTKVSKVKALANDLALALAVPSGSVRILTPIPGTSYIGIEIPNDSPNFVKIKEIITSKEWSEFNGMIPFSLGKDVTGKNIISDLTKMPHILIAGATGSGKSIAVNTFLCGSLMSLSPDQLKFILVDPKMVELTPYNDIPHLLTPVITEVDNVVNALQWLVNEMQRRYRILKQEKVRNIKQYNELMGYPELPYIVLVIDEMADLMLTTGAEVESRIVRLAQMARAVGIHLVLATQRPSVDVITGLIKANVPARVGMSVATSIDSRVVIDMPGAETLLGNGDMLFKAPDISKPYRIQGAYVSNEEIERITDFVKTQVDNVDYDANIIKPQTEGAKGDSTEGGVSDDPLFADAVQIVVSSQKASASLLQRKLRIGYNRAARLMDELYEKHVVGPEDGSKARKVLITDANSFLNK
ncbi:DNA translocase FtsK [Candidatus Dojkabacteria bacterium]|nr:DNA translocase FtsK [Candidatus Dojkabacteria bacterium]